MIETRIVDPAHKQDINIPNQPFELFGRMIVSYSNCQWSYITECFESVSEMCFPDENYDYDEMSKDHIFIGAYDNEKCVGLAIMRHSMFKYLYLYDLKVNTDYRRHGVAGRLIDTATELAEQLRNEPVTVTLNEYGGFEKVGKLPWSLTKTDERIVTESGDIMLYQGNQMTIFYDSNTWSYTRLGHIDNVTAEELMNILGNGDITIMLSLK